MQLIPDDQQKFPLPLGISLIQIENAEWGSRILGWYRKIGKTGRIINVQDLLYNRLLHTSRLAFFDPRISRLIHISITTTTATLNPSPGFPTLPPPLRFRPSLTRLPVRVRCRILLAEESCRSGRRPLEGQG